MKNVLFLFLFMLHASCLSQDTVTESVVLHFINKYNLEIDGALRFNYNLSTWKTEQVKRGGDFGYDLFRLNIKSRYKKIYLDAEFRQYSNAFGGAMLKRGIMGYAFANKVSRIELGLTQVPFGNQEYNSNCWFFNLPYYIGFEDDYDMGIKFVHDWRKLRLHLAFFKNAEELTFGDATPLDHSRYSYDIAGRNKEVNQGNAKLDFILDRERENTASIFVQYGGLYNVVNHKTGDQIAFGVAYDQHFYEKRLGIKFEALGYIFQATDSAQYDYVVDVAAYGSSYQVASSGELITLGVSYLFTLKNKTIEEIKIYNDAGVYLKSVFRNSYMNVLGALISSGPFQAYVDFAFGKNHPWLGPAYNTAFTLGNPDDRWDLRFNINLGYYF